MVAAAAVILTVVGGLALQNRALQKDNRTLITNNAALELAVETQKGAIEAAINNAQEWQAAHAGLQERIEELANVQQAATAEQRRLQDIFSRHDLEALAIAKPGLIESRIIAGSNDANSMLERITAGDLQLPARSGNSAGTTSTAESRPN